MPRQKKCTSPPTFESFDDGFDEDDSSNSSKNGNPPVQRNVANARERARMRVLSSAFGRLKTKLPNIPPDTKLSKLDTLRLATIYIKQLKALVDGGTNCIKNEEELPPKCNSFTCFQDSTQNMTWPFTFQHIHTTSRHLSSHFTNTNEFQDNQSEQILRNKPNQQHQRVDEFISNNNFFLNDCNTRNNCIFSNDFPHSRSISSQNNQYQNHQNFHYEQMAHTQII